MSDKPFDPNQHLGNLLDNRDKSLGIGGDYTFRLDVKKGKEFKDFIAIPNLTKEASRKLFDLFDENNKCTQLVQVRIRITQKNKEVDLNYLPNIHTE